jgi:hypothetical protein
MHWHVESVNKKRRRVISILSNSKTSILQHTLLSQTLQPAASKIPWEAMAFSAKSNALHHTFLQDIY